MPRYIVRAPDEIDVASGSGTTNRLMRFDSSDDAADGSLLDDGSGALKQPGATTDVAPTVVSLIGAHAYAQASSNTTGANLRLAPGIGRRFITIDDYAQAGTGTVTVTVNGTATVLTAGTDFTAATSNAVTATNLATAIEAIAGVSATAVSAVVYVTPDDTTYTLTLARSVAAFATVTSGTDGSVSVATGTFQFPDGTAAAPSLSFTDDTNLGLFRVGANSIGVSVGAVDAPFAVNDTVGAVLHPSYYLAWTASTVATAADLFLARAAAATPYFHGSSTSVGATIRIGNTNVGYEDLARNSESHTLAAAGTSTTSTAVWPASSASLAATFRITTEITGCTSVQVGVSGDTTRYGTFSTLTAGQTIAIGRVDNYSAQTGILFTAVGGGASFTAGVIRVNLRYITASAPTS